MGGELSPLVALLRRLVTPFPSAWISGRSKDPLFKPWKTKESKRLRHASELLSDKSRSICFQAELKSKLDQKCSLKIAKCLSRVIMCLSFLSFIDI